MLNRYTFKFMSSTSRANITNYSNETTYRVTIYWVEGGHRIRIWNVGGRLAKYLKPGVRKEMLCICRTPDVLCYRLQTLFLVDSTKMYHLELNELSVDRIA